MDVLNKVMEMQSKGMPDSEIAKTLRNNGVSSKEINDALNNAKIKSAVSQEYPYSQQEMQNMPQQDMQQSIMQSSDYSQYPQNQEQYAQYSQNPQNQEQYAQYPQQEAYAAQYPETYSESYSPQLNTDTIYEISEQVALEKIDEFRKKIGDVSQFRNTASEKLKELDERLKKIEDAIEQLQTAVIGKIGEFGETSAYIKKDLNSIHETMSKLMNPLIDNYKELKKIAKGQ